MSDSLICIVCFSDYVDYLRPHSDRGLRLRSYSSFNFRHLWLRFSKGQMTEVLTPVCRYMIELMVFKNTLWPIRLHQIFRMLKENSGSYFIFMKTIFKPTEPRRNKNAISNIMRLFIFSRKTYRNVFTAQDKNTRGIQS